MATLTNPVSATNIIARFEDYVTNYANNQIVWYNNSSTDNNTPSWFPRTYLGSNSITTGREEIPDGAGTEINAATIYSTLVAATNKFTRIRSLTARRRAVSTGSGNETRTVAPNTIIDEETEIAALPSAYLQDIQDASNDGPVANAGVASGQEIDLSNLQAFMLNLRNAYLNSRDQGVTITHDVCHTSCHSSCHNSRGRR